MNGNYGYAAPFMVPQPNNPFFYPQPMSVGANQFMIPQQPMSQGANLASNQVSTAHTNTHDNHTEVSSAGLPFKILSFLTMH